MPLKVLLTQWRPHLLADVFNQSPALHVIHEIKKNFDGGQHNSRVGMLQLHDDSFRHHLSF